MLETSSGENPENNIIKKGQRTIRREENGNLSEFVIKTSLKSLLNDGLTKQDKNIIKNSLMNRTIAMSKGYQRLSFSSNIYYLELLESNSISTSNFLSNKDTTFFRQLLLGPSNRKEDTETSKKVKQFLTKYDNYLPPIQTRLIGDSNTTVNAVEDYITNVKNYLKINFEPFLRRYIKSWTKDNKIEGYDSVIFNLICFNGYNYRDYVAKQEIIDFVKVQRDLLNLNNQTVIKKGKECIEDIKITDSWINNNYETIIKYFHTISKYFISKEEAGLLTCPVVNAKRLFIHIDSETFYYIIKELKQFENLKKDVFNENRQFYWDEIFNTKKFISKKNRNLFNFTFTIETDGHVVNIHYRRPKLEKITRQKEQIEEEIMSINKSLNNFIVYGADTGRKNLLTLATLNEDNKTYKIFQLTKEQYYEEAGLNKYFKLTQKLKNKLKVIYDELSLHSTRKSSLITFLGYVSVIVNNYEVVWQRMTKLILSRKKFESYSKKKQCYDNFFKKVKSFSPDKQVVISYGASNFKSSGINEKSAPTTRLYKEASKHCLIYLIDEYNTTKRYYKNIDGTYPQLHKVKQRMTERYLQTRKLIRNNRKDRIINEKLLNKEYNKRGLLAYCSPLNKITFVSRDVNPAKIMINLFRIYPKRPIEFTNKCVNKSLPSIKLINRL